jgi:hypothetical protein
MLQCTLAYTSMDKLSRVVYGRLRTCQVRDPGHAAAHEAALEPSADHAVCWLFTRSHRAISACLGMMTDPPGALAGALLGDTASAPCSLCPDASEMISARHDDQRHHSSSADQHDD